MNLWTLVLRGLRHYRRTNAGLVAGSAIATAVLVGALVVGDSVRASLRGQAELRIGAVDAVLASNDRFFRAALADELARDGIRTAPAIQVPGVASTSDSARRVHDVQVYGVDGRFFELGPSGETPAELGPREAFVNQELAQRLAIAVGDEIVVRVELPSAIPRDMVLALDDVSVAVRVEVKEVLTDERCGRFSLLATQLPPANLFLSLESLQQELEVVGRANLLLADVDAPAERGTADLNTRLRSTRTLDDFELELRELADGRRELRTSRVFIDDPITAVLAELKVELTGILTYFVNSLSVGERTTPYSMVTGLGSVQLYEPPADLEKPDYYSIVNPFVEENEIVLGRWIADDLQAEAGDELRMRYFVIDPSRRLVEHERVFTVDSIVPVKGLAGDRELMPPFPGLADAENCREWETGVPVDLDAIRDEDEAYWDDHGGTPKAFLPLRVAQSMWSSRFGSLTAVRFRARDEGTVRQALDDLDPAALGLFFMDVRTAAEDSSNSPTDFGGLFVALSFFLIAAALLLTTLLFLFGIEQRTSEIGLYAALGFPPRLVKKVFFLEALVLAAGGALVGALLGLAYTRAVLHGLATIWSDAIASSVVGFHAEPATVLIGLLASLGVTAATVWFALRKKLAVSSFRLLTSEHGVTATEKEGRVARLVWPVLIWGGLIGALAMVFLVDPSSGPSAAGAFFGAGTLVLISAIGGCRALLLRTDARSTRAVRSIRELGIRNSTRRTGRSLATVSLMAIGTFLVVAVGVNRLGPVTDASDPSSGTGGFALFGRSSLPVTQDLNSAEGRAAFALDPEELANVAFVPLRVRDGDDASCLNLSRPQSPRLIAVNPAAFARRGSFTFAASDDAEGNPWLLLDEPLVGGEVPAIGDATSLTWQLHKSIGDTLEYTDERGRPFTVRIVGAINDTILQGNLVIGEDRFEELFPSEGGYRMLLVDAPSEKAEGVAATLSRAFEDLGLSLESTADRLDAFHAVQNGYLAIFQLLGALGLLLGTVGLGMVVLRNTLERRGELALAGALGFTPRNIRWWVFSEYGFLLLLGLAAGGAASLMAILPAARAPGANLPLINLLALTGLVAANGLFWIWVATRAAVHRTPLAALSEE